MTPEARPPARNRQQPAWVQFLGISALLLCLSCLTACNAASSAGSGSSGNPQVSANLSPADVGVPYHGTVSVSGGKAPYLFSLASGSLPSGLVLSQSTGSISGTPAKTGVYSFAVQATDATGMHGAQSFQIPVSAAGTITVTVSPANATVSSSGTAQFTALVTNTYNVGVTWSASPGTINASGFYQAPAVTSSTSATVTATSSADSTRSGKTVITIAPVVAPALAVTTSSLSGATTGTNYSATLKATGGTTPYAWSVVSGTLPSGLSLQSSGLLSGTTNQVGQFSITVQVMDSSSARQTATQPLALSVSAIVIGKTAPSTLFGFTSTNTSVRDYPTVTYGMQRFWDSPPLQWPSINTASGVYDFTNLDSVLAQAYTSGVMEGMYTLARTPPWASSKPSDTSCHYTTATSGGGAGECDAPIDLNADGTGTNAIWKAWITAIATHANNPTYLQTHAHIKYWEIWNEPDATFYWSGSFAQLARLTEDANCIITGHGVIHESGNGTATPCTVTPIDPTAQIVMASGHADSASNLNYAQNQLYCNASPAGYQLPCPNPPNAIATAIDIVNFHMKPGNATGNHCPSPVPCTPETAMQTYVANVHGILQSAELAKPLWDGEASYAQAGFTGAYTDPDMAASFMPRFYLMTWSLDVSGIAWYDWTYLTTQPAAVQTAYQQTYNWLADSTLTTPCAASGSVYSCTINKAGTQYLIMWDSSQSCASGFCTAANQTVDSQWSQYQDMTTANAPISISGRVVPVGIKPVVLH